MGSLFVSANMNLFCVQIAREFSQVIYGQTALVSKREESIEAFILELAPSLI